MIWKYSIEQGGTGIVFADNEIEAINKVRSAYGDHSSREGFTEEVIVKHIENGWFADHPDVIELED